MCLLDVAMEFLLHKQTVITRAVQAGPNAATMELRCLSTYHITCPICQCQPHFPEIFSVEKRKEVHAER